MAAAATLIAFLVAIATSKQSSVLHTTERRRHSTSHNSSGSRSDDSDSISNIDSDSDGNSDDGRESDSPELLRADVENRLAAFQRDQEASLQEFRANTLRQRRLLSERSTAESGRLTAAIDDLRRRFVDHQANLRETNRAIQDLRVRGPHTPRGSPSQGRVPQTPSPPRIRERSNTPTAPRVVFEHLSGVARPARGAATANVAPILARDCDHRQRR